MSTATQLTLGGLGIALLILALNLYGFWTVGKKDPAHLAPFGAGVGMGALATMCVGGLYGWAASALAGGANGGGDRAVPGATGGDSRPITTGTTAALTDGGGLLVFILSGVFAVALRSASKKPSRRMLGGLIVGACLAYTAGVAGLLDDTLAPAVNAAGDQLLGFFEGAL